MPQNLLTELKRGTARPIVRTLLYLLIAALLFLTLFAETLHNHPSDLEAHHEECPVFLIERLFSVLIFLSVLFFNFGICYSGPFQLTRRLRARLIPNSNPGRAPPLSA